ncbi:MAG TPA: VWA domain-containing protein [Acidobacteriota bacterium]|nr:VWA domain-containing protein [Acidobacteriota bacterium]
MGGCYTVGMRLFVLLLLFFPAFQVAQDDPSPNFRVRSNFIKVPVTVMDERGKLINTLTKDDFALIDEGQQRPIENFLLTQAPVNVALLLDVSGSLEEEIDEIKQAALRFVSAFDRQDHFAVISFAERVEVLQDWTNRKKKIKKALKKLEPGLRTALWDALLETTRETIAKVSGRRVIIVLTDGLDNQSLSNYEDAIHGLLRNDVSLYIVSRTRIIKPQVAKSNRVEFLNRVMKNVLEEDANYVDIYFEEKETAMEHLAESTGGRVLFPTRLVELRNSYAQVARELKNQYLLTFEPPLESDRRFRRIEVVCKRDEGRRIYHRLQYAWTSPQ